MILIETIHNVQLINHFVILCLLLFPFFTVVLYKKSAICVEVSNSAAASAYMLSHQSHEPVPGNEGEASYDSAPMTAHCSKTLLLQYLIIQNIV
jgi:hypothetical protein